MRNGFTAQDNGRSLATIGTDILSGRRKKGDPMRVMVAGASGAVGRRLVPLLVEAGHTVTGLTRSAIKAEALRAAGADAFAANARDPSALRAATLGVRP